MFKMFFKDQEKKIWQSKQGYYLIPFHLTLTAINLFKPLTFLETLAQTDFLLYIHIL